MEVLTLCFPSRTFLHIVAIFQWKSSTSLSRQNGLMHPTTDLKSIRFSCLKKGEKYLVIDFLFVTLCNIKASLGTARLDSELVLDTKGYGVGKTGQSCTWVILDCKEVRSWEQLYLCSKTQLYFLWNWYCFCSVWARETQQTESKTDSNNCKVNTLPFLLLGFCLWLIHTKLLPTVHRKVKTGGLSCSALLVATTYGPDLESWYEFGWSK